MIRKIICGPGFCAVTEDGVLVEYIPNDPSDQCGDILLGKTDRLMPGMNCAFVDIGRKKSGFLPLDENSNSFTGGKVRSGESLTVQIKKEENGTKGAFLTRDITLPGTMVILMPMNRYIGVSSRITDESVREELKKTGREIATDRFGLVMRKAAEAAAPEMIRQEAESLYETWRMTEEKASKGGKPGSILFSGSIAERLQEDYARDSITTVQESAETDDGIARQVRQARERTVRLPGGGNIVMDRCEAMTVIDINTASAAVSGSKAQTILETNLEACGAIAQQVRLRNLSGIILIDFIDMDNETDRSMVLTRLEECFSRDRVKTVIHGWTSLGLIEMTRKRTRTGIYDNLLKACPVCGGTGYVLREQRE